MSQGECGMTTAPQTHQDARSKEVFALRKAGELDQALEKGRVYYAETPGDVWLIRAYGWTLNDCLKRANNQGDMEALKALYEEFKQLDVPKDDALMRQKQEEWSERMPAGEGDQTEQALLEDAKRASDSGRFEDALSLFREAVTAYPASVRASIGLGWELQRSLGNLLKEEHPDAAQMESLLAEYRQLPHHERPGLLHSLMLQRAAKAAKAGHFADFVPFLQWWDPKYFRDEDYAAYRPPNADRDLPGTVAITIMGVYKALKKEQDISKIGWAVDFIGTHIDRFPDEPWFPYYHGKLLAKCGHGDEARPLVLPIVKAKPNEFWTWDCLADTFGPDQIEMRIACLCRALQCKSQKSAFMIHVHEALGTLLIQQNLFDEARYEIDQVIEIRRVNKWSINSSLLSRTQQPWYLKAKQIPDNQVLYAAHAPKAMALLTQDTPVRLGVVTGINREKALTVVKISRDEVILLFHRQFPKAANLNPGQAVKVWAERDETRERWTALSFERCDKLPDSEFIKTFSGTLKRCPGRAFAFVTPEDIFCPPPVLTKIPANQDGLSVEGLAVLERNPQNGAYGWKAVVLTPTDCR
jgi:tetratricopeptide (TPR) repeat protein